MNNAVSEGRRAAPVWYDLDADRQDIRYQDAIRHLQFLGNAIFIPLLRLRPHLGLRLSVTEQTDSEFSTQALVTLGGCEPPPAVNRSVKVRNMFDGQEDMDWEESNMDCTPVTEALFLPLPSQRLLRCSGQY